MQQSDYFVAFVMEVCEVQNEEFISPVDLAFLWDTTLSDLWDLMAAGWCAVRIVDDMYMVDASVLNSVKSL